MEWPGPSSGAAGSPGFIDLGKNVCSVVGLDASGAMVLRRRAKRETLIGFAKKLPPCTVGMGAGCGAQ